MKKLLILILSLVIVLGFGVQSALAQPGNGNGHQNQQQSEKGQQCQFSDTKGHWAENAIEKMQGNGFIKGYANGTFQPNKPVTEIEAIVMVVRAMGLEDEAQDAEVGTLISGLKQVPSWAAGYLQVALDNDVITEAELLSFQPNQGAKRIVVALWLSRALDLDEYIDEDTELPFLDQSEISDDLHDAVVLIYEAGIMKGDGHNCFQPNKAITRAEMAVLLDRVDASDADDIFYKNTDFKGFITAVDADSITVERWDISKTFDFADDVTVTLDGEDAEIADLDEGLHVKLTLNSDGEVTAVKACTPDENKEGQDVEDHAGQFEGKITNIDINDDGADYISIKQGYHIYIFTVDNDTKITLDDGTAKLSDLEVGSEVEIKAENGVAASIHATSDEDEAEENAEYKGTIESISNSQIVIEDKHGVNHTFDITSDTEITVDGNDADVSHLAVGDKVEIKANSDNDAVTIEVDND